MQSALDPAGQQAADISWLWWLIFGVCTAIYVLVMGGARGCAVAAAPAAGAPPDTATGRERPDTAVSWRAASAVTVAILLVFLVATIRSTARCSPPPTAPRSTIEVTGHQWWWEVRVPGPGAEQRSSHRQRNPHPGRQTVRLTLRSPDVIHSFWVPNLAGKRDLIPGQTNYIWITAERPGTYRGQCAEFCGLQHAHMALYVTVEDRPAFERWQEQQRQPAPSPTTPEAQRGLEVFLSGPCVMCHTIRGTTAGATTGPDLTHVASRPSIGAGRLPNTRGHLRRLDRRPADPQARQQDAAGAAPARGFPGASELSRYAEMMPR